MFVIYFEKYQIALGEWVFVRAREWDREWVKVYVFALERKQKSWFIKKGKIAKAWKNCFGKEKKLS